VVCGYIIDLLTCIEYNARSSIYTSTQQLMNQRFIQLWKELETDAQDEKYKNTQSLFENDANRINQFSFEVENIFVDFSKNWINKDVFAKLIDLSHSANLGNKINAMFDGKKINVSENKAATHTFQRKSNSTTQILNCRQKMLNVARKYQTKQWKSAFAKDITTVVNIGIGGSYLGPKLAVEALSELQTTNKIKILFYPSVDSVSLQSIIQSCDLTSTLFCIGSKSLGTIETARNTDTILALLKDIKGYQPSATNQSFVAATTNLKKAHELNIPESHLMPFDEATGGRFSVWSSIGFPVLMAIGEEKFLEFLSGAEKIDNHF